MYIAPVDGGYGPWGPNSDCSVTCGVGMRTRTRNCDSPAPRNGGKLCEGPSIRTARCKMPSCSTTIPGLGFSFTPQSFLNGFLVAAL